MDVAVAEKIFLDARGVKVTNARFIVHKQTYAMASVSSVKVCVTDKTPSKTAPIVVAAIGGLWFLGAYSNGFKAMLLPVGMIVAGILWYRSIKTVYEYKIVLTTSSGETTALTSTSEPDIRVVETALNDAIVFRG